MGVVPLPFSRWIFSFMVPHNIPSTHANAPQRCRFQRPNYSFGGFIYDDFMKVAPNNFIFIPLIFKVWNGHSSVSEWRRAYLSPIDIPRDINCCSSCVWSEEKKCNSTKWKILWNNLLLTHTDGRHCRRVWEYLHVVRQLFRILSWQAAAATPSELAVTRWESCKF